LPERIVEEPVDILARGDGRPSGPLLPVMDTHPTLSQNAPHQEPLTAEIRL
jgi:hypothetical protein